MTRLKEWRNRHRLLLRVTLIYTFLIFGNELLRNCSGMLQKFYNAKVLKSIGGEMSAATSMIAFDLACMLILALLLTACIAFAWAAICTNGFQVHRERYGDKKIILTLYWLLTSIAFFNFYYFLHNTLIPQRN